jgi:drug/metabolite transporter (DMT)-like permease
MMGRYILIILMGAASYGILSTFVVKAYMAGFTVNQVTGSQSMYGVILMIALWLIIRRRTLRNDIRGITLKSLVILIPIGICVGATSMLYYVALQYIPTSLAIILLFQFVWLGVLVESIIDRRKPSRSKIIALVVVIIGTGLAAGLINGGWSNINWTGILFGLLSAVSYTGFIVLSGRATLTVDPYTRSTVVIVISMILVFSVYPPTFLMDGSWHSELLLWGLLLAFFGIVLPTVSFAIGVPKIGGGLASILSSAELPVAVLMSSFVLHEHVAGLQWFGVILILIGVFMPMMRMMNI